MSGEGEVESADESLGISASTYDAELPENLAKLAEYPDSAYIRYWVAGHPNTPIESLALLAEDAEEDVRYKVAWNPNCTPEILLKLARDASSEVRYRVACNPKCPVEAVLLLMQDERQGVRNAALRRV
jgi:hypothetical protein